ncbi:DNA phosphorothioation-associated putative methyltransferase [Benzoatithermus flavus]|uniref:DNA phosphorothioation-associated putative methyltransferase n=1 Tax=Benzoatithermus flavus TaxID=3108223 RepID=A0ABU8XP71_9PROT
MSHSVGKRVHGTLYLHQDALGTLGAEEQALVHEAGRLAGDFAWNVVKLDPERPGRVGLLRYEPFDAVPFPALLDSAAVDVRAGRVVRRSFQRSANPPILHRKELLLPEGHPDRERYAALTRSLERLGLFAGASRIGFRQAWEARLAAAAMRIEGHRLVEVLTAPAAAPGDTQVERHRTAIARDRLSAPMQALARHGLLVPERTVLDYGCGQGDDVRALLAGGFTATGWDPHFAPDAPREPADIVNLGFVLNVIEEPAERVEALRSAFALARQCLSVAVMLAGKSDTTGLQPYRDGFLTRRGTFQRYFRQEEIKAFVEEMLGEEAIATGPGIFLVFRDKLFEQRFLLGRQSRQPAAGLALKLRPPRERPSADERDLAALRPLLEGLWRRMLELGRPADANELDPELVEALHRAPGGLRRAERLCGTLFDPQALTRAAAARKDDLRVYFALNLFDGRTRYTALPPELQRDVRAFFGSHAQVMEEARTLLFSVGEPAVIKAACEQAYDSGLGWLEDEHALVLTTALVSRLPAALLCRLCRASVRRHRLCRPRPDPHRLGQAHAAHLRWLRRPAAARAAGTDQNRPAAAAGRPLRLCRGRAGALDEVALSRPRPARLRRAGRLRHGAGSTRPVRPRRLRPERCDPRGAPPPGGPPRHRLLPRRGRRMSDRELPDLGAFGLHLRYRDFVEAGET